MLETDLLQKAIKEEVKIIPYDREWARRFEDEKSRLLKLFPDDLNLIEHIGSTAVPGLPAKPIIDLIAAVASIELADRLTLKLRYIFLYLVPSLQRAFL